MWVLVFPSELSFIFFSLFLFFLLPLLRYRIGIQQSVYDFKVNSIMIWLMYIMKRSPQVKFSEYPSSRIDT